MTLSHFTDVYSAAKTSLQARCFSIILTVWSLPAVILALSLQFGRYRPVS